MRRRTFVGGAFASLPITGAFAKPPRVKSGDIPMKEFGKTGHKVTIVGQAGGRFYLCTFSQAKAVTLKAYDLGINYFDCAHLYWDGRSEDVYGEALKPFRKEVFLTSKAQKRTREEAEKELHQSLMRMQTDYLDLWSVHAVSTMDDVEKVFAPGGAMEAFVAAKKAGKCRFIGFTGHHDPHIHMEMMKRYDKFDTIFMPLHIADSSYLSFEKIALQEAAKRNLGVQVMKSLANSRLLKTFTLKECLDFVLTLPVSVVAMGAVTPQQIEEDVRIAQQFKPLSAGQMAELRERGKAVSGPALEDWKRKEASAGAAAYVGG